MQLENKETDTQGHKE